MSANIRTEIKTQDASPPPMVIPLAHYISPPEFDLEKEHIFGKVWRFIGHTADVPKNGDFFVRQFDVPKASIFVVRGADGVVRAFHNICRHRGNLLIRDKEVGCKARFMCSFHGWTWSNTGELLGVTDESQFPQLDKSTLGLLTVQCEVWNGLIFVNFLPKPQETLLDWLGELAGDYQRYFLDQHKVSSHQFELAMNWNLGVNAFTEGYHTLYIHQHTAGDYQGGKANPQRHRPFMQFMRHHLRYSAPANPDHKLVPAEALAYRYGRRLLPSACFDNDSLPPAINPSRAENWLFDVVEIFPNVVMLFGQHYRIEITFQPVSAAKTIVTNETFVYKAANLAERAGQELFLTREREVVREDLSLLEAQQQALSSGAMRDVYLSRQEMALAHHYKVRETMLRGA